MTGTGTGKGTEAAGGGTESPDGAAVLAFTGPAALEEWLERHHADSKGIWLKLAKKASGVESVTIGEVHEANLCFGWIDGQRRAYDATYYLQKITPRRPRGTWSQVNVDKVEALRAAGRMRPSGLAEVEAAQADGRWAAAYAPQATATVPPDLEEALSAAPAARRTFDALGKSDRYLVVLRLMTAKTGKTRAARLERMVARLAAGEKVR
ncbi:YdeI family protein [Streptomyces sp. NPDC091292]|uniref:YdeI/OmpD-associated family protein n=1 Tax=Streptomyces sp. NPDC091292 TaxID=3365991 RepID=UPI003807599E